MTIGGLAFIGGGMLFGMRWMQISSSSPDATDTPADEATAPNTPAESESAIVIGGVLRNAPNGGLTRTRAASPPPAPQVHDDCDPPFSVDARGVRHAKPQCASRR
jgi:serine/threonine-protein kinase